MVALCIVRCFALNQIKGGLLILKCFTDGGDMKCVMNSSWLGE